MQASPSPRSNFVSSALSQCILVPEISDNGDKEKFLDKFRTCIRARPYPEQNLPTEFYVKEHSEPLFIKNKILN